MKGAPLSAQLRSLAADLREDLGPDHRALVQIEGAAAILDVAGARGAQLIAAWDAEADAADAAAGILAAQRALIWGSAALGVEAVIRLLGVDPAAPAAPAPGPELPAGVVPEPIPCGTRAHRLARWSRRAASPPGAGR